MKLANKIKTVTLHPTLDWLHFDIACNQSPPELGFVPEEECSREI